MSNLIRIRNLSKIIVKIHTYLPLKYILTNIYISFLEEFLKSNQFGFVAAVEKHPGSEKEIRTSDCN